MASSLPSRTLLISCFSKKNSCVLWFMPPHKSVLLRIYPSRISYVCDHSSL
jgi:hypothetical protein